MSVPEVWDWVVRACVHHDVPSNRPALIVERTSASAQRREVLTVTGWEVSEEGVLSRNLPPLIEKDAAGELLTSLWALGVRPAEWGHEGEIQATRAHLADVRRLLADQTGVDLP